MIWKLRWESAAFGDRSASSMSNYGAGMNSDLGNRSFWVEFHDAEHVDQCRWRSTWVWARQLTSDLNRCLIFFGNACKWSCLKAVSGPHLSLEGCGASCTPCFHPTSSIQRPARTTISSGSDKGYWLRYLSHKGRIKTNTRQFHECSVIEVNYTLVGAEEVLYKRIH